MLGANQYANLELRIGQHFADDTFGVNEVTSNYRLSKDVLHAEVGEEIVLMDSASGNYFGVKGVFRHVFHMLSEGASLERMAAEVASQVKVSREQAEQDIGGILSKMESAGLVVSRKQL